MATSRPPRREGVVEIRMGAVRRLLWMVALIAVLAGIGIAVKQRERLFPTAAGQIDHGAYQAVFLATNQVYFGRLGIIGDTYLLSDVFYLSQPTEAGTTSQLLKRGGEPHGPREPMVIPARSVLYFENLRDDSVIVAGIRSFKSGQGSSPAVSAPPATSAPTARPSATR